MLLPDVPTYRPRRRGRRRRATAVPPPVDGHQVLAVVVMGGGGAGGPEVRWDFDGPVAGTGEACQGLIVGGHNPAGVYFTPGDSFVVCIYPGDPAPGTPWQFTGPASEITFDDGRPGIPSTGVCVPE